MTKAEIEKAIMYKASSKKPETGSFHSDASRIIENSKNKCKFYLLFVIETYLFFLSGETIFRLKFLKIYFLPPSINSEKKNCTISKAQFFCHFRHSFLITPVSCL